MPLDAPPSSPPLAGLTIDLQIIRATGLVVKDKNWRGKYTTSDPFIRIFVDGIKRGYTKTIWKAVDPEWNEQVVVHIGADEVQQVLRNQAPIELQIFDKDRLSFNDPMGVVQIPLNTETEDPVWYPVGTKGGAGGDGNCECANATGQVQVAVKIRARKYLELERGNLHPLGSEMSSLRLGLSWDYDGSTTARRSRGKDLDIACAAVSRSGTIELRLPW